MKLKGVAAIFGLAIPAFAAHAQQSGPQQNAPKPIKADAENVVQIITNNEMKTQAYCDLTKLEVDPKSSEAKEFTSIAASTFLTQQRSSTHV